MTVGLSSAFPEAVGVRFRGKPCYAVVTTDGSPPLFYSKTILIEDVGVIENVEGAFGTKIIHSSALAKYSSSSGEPTNKSALDDLAKQIATDYYRWLQKSFDESYNQIIGPVVDGLTDTIEFTYRTDYILSRRYSSPYNGFPEELFQHDPADCLDSESKPYSEVPCIMFYGPPFKCVDNKPVITRYKVCFLGGNLIQEFISEDTLG